MTERKQTWADIKEEPINIKPQDRIFPIRCDLCTTNRNVYLQEVTR
jgi:hypothetical protein